MTKKTISIFLLFLMILSGVIYPMRAYAFLGIVDININLENIAEWLINEVVKTIAETFKQRMLQMVTNQIIDYIQGGGDPRFVTNFGSVAEEAFQAAAGDTIIELGYRNLCYEPLRFKLEFQLKQQSVFRQQVNCTLDDVVGNIAAFKEDFTSGGWIAYQETLMPQNNPMGITLLTQQEFLRRKSEEESRKEYESTVGGGFLGDKKCTKWKALEENTYVHSGGEGPPGYKYSEGDEVVVGDEDWEDAMYKETPSGDKYTGKSGMPGSGEWQCAESETVTPGKVAGEAVTKAMGADIETLIAAEDIAPYISAIINAAINRVTKETVSGLAYMTTGEAEEANCNELKGGVKVACKVYKAISAPIRAIRDKLFGWLGSKEKTKAAKNALERAESLGEDMPKDMDEYEEQMREELENMKSILLSDLDKFAGDNQSTLEKLQSASSTLYEASSRNSQTIEELEGQEDSPVRGLIQCWEAKIREAEIAGESTSTIAALEENKETASEILAEAEDDTELINKHLFTIENYEDRRDQLESNIEAAYDYDLNNLEEIIENEESFHLDAVSTEVYEFLDAVSVIPDEASQIKIRVDDRFEKVNDEFDQCTNQEF